MTDQRLEREYHRINEALPGWARDTDDVPLSAQVKTAFVTLQVEIDRLRGERGTCSSCRWWVAGLNKRRLRDRACSNPDTPAMTFINARPDAWGCTLHEPQSPATEEASK
jgi:hypothetical protein